MNHKTEFIPQKIALELCEEIRLKNQQKRLLFSIGKMQCHFCWHFGKKAFIAGNPAKLCAFGSDNNRGCWQVNKLYDNQVSNGDSSYHS
ncbi:MAG: hypothetical protein ACFFB2_15945 [Promethearchaeota archaeon]